MTSTRAISETKNGYGPKSVTFHQSHLNGIDIICSYFYIFLGSETIHVLMKAQLKLFWHLPSRNSHAIGTIARTRREDLATLLSRRMVRPKMCKYQKASMYSPCVCVCAHMCMYIYIYTHTYVYIYIYIHCIT